MKKSSPGTEGGAKTDVLTSRFHFTQAGGQSTETIDRLLFKPVMVFVDITHETAAVVVPALIDTKSGWIRISPRDFEVLTIGKAVNI
jgi:hypothetical protein